MATALAGIITPALQMLGKVASGSTPTSAEQSDCLAALNQMAEGWRNERLMCFAMQEESLTLASADPSYTIGTSGDLNTTRPVAIERAWIVSGTTSYKVREMGEDKYVSIADKTTASDWPDRFLYRPSMASSLGTIIVYPVPNAARTLKLLTRVVFSGFAATSTTVTLPPGWEEALAANLAVRMAPVFETQAPADVKELAKTSKGNIKRVNSRSIKSFTDLAGLVGQRSTNILTGE